MKYTSDLECMSRALVYARQAFDEKEVPIGALIVDSEGLCIGTGYNQTESKNCQTAHAEVIAIEQACAHKKTWRLDKCTLYVTVEPCMMCMGLIGLSRIARLVYGIDSQKFGFSRQNCTLHDTHVFSHLQDISSGVCAEQAHELLRQFFKKKR